MLFVYHKIRYVIHKGDRLSQVIYKKSTSWVWLIYYFV
jgi:hypothetical protein